MRTNIPLLKIESISKSFKKNNSVLRAKNRNINALSNISFELKKGEILGLIGESGSGKSTLGKCLLRLCTPDSGRIIYQDKDLLQCPDKEFATFRSKFQMIFQHAAQALNPMHTIGVSLSEPLLVINGLKKKQIDEKIKRLLDSVGLNPSILVRYPNQLSGGQKQRVLIARALSVEPELLIADEPTSSLDVALKKQILNLFQSIHDQFDLTLVLISHDISIFESRADRIAVLYRGKLVELAATNQILKNPAHPYTRELVLASYLDLDTTPWFTDPGKSFNKGCPVQNRCPAVSEKCVSLDPVLEELAPDHFVACHFKKEVALQKFTEKWQQQIVTPEAEESGEIK